MRHFAVVRDERALLDVVGEIELKGLVLREREDERRQIAREEQARVVRDRRGEVQRRENRDTVDHYRLTWLRRLAVAAAIRREVDDDRSGLHALHGVGADE